MNDFGYKYIYDLIDNVEKIEKKINDLRAEGYKIVGSPAATDDGICIIMEKSASQNNFLPTADSSKKDFTGEF